MKLPYISEKKALFVMITLVLVMLVVGLINWPKGKSPEELRLINKMHQDSLKNAGKPEVFK